MPSANWLSCTTWRPSASAPPVSWMTSAPRSCSSPTWPGATRRCARRWRSASGRPGGGEPLRAAMEQRLGLPVVVENDANAAAWAEARFGAGRGEDYVIVLTVGTGIGGGIVVGGQLLRGRFGVAAEIDHLNIVPDGRRCGCGLQGCWEQYASGRALVVEAQEQASASPAMAGKLLALAGGRVENITGPMITEAAQEGDVAALGC